MLRPSSIIRSLVLKIMHILRSYATLVPQFSLFVQCLKSAFLLGGSMEMVLFLGSLVEAVTIFCFLHGYK